MCLEGLLEQQTLDEVTQEEAATVLALACGRFNADGTERLKDGYGKGSELGFAAVLTSLCHRPSTVRCGFRRLGRKHSAAHDLHREP